MRVKKGTTRTDPVRSRIMRAVKSRDTKPEMLVRRMVRAMGYRYRLHRKDLPGKPDLVFSSRKKIIFVHGCFWHGHDCLRGDRMPKTNRKYWKKKISGNVKRDVKHTSELKKSGWEVLLVWECETRDAEALTKSLNNFLSG